jgi:hypothetical protein
MSDLLQKLLAAPLSTILVIAGLFFVFVGLGGNFGEAILTENIPPLYATPFGAALVAAGIILYFVMPQRPSGSHADVVTFSGARKNSGSVFVNLESGTRQRFGSQDTKHNDTCWVGQRSEGTMSIGFVEVPMHLPGILLDRIHVTEAKIWIEEFTKVENTEVTRWLGPLMVVAQDYGELDVADADDVLNKGETIRSYDNVYDLYKPTDITSLVRQLFGRREDRLRLVFVFPGQPSQGSAAGKLQFEPTSLKVKLNYRRSE